MIKIVFKPATADMGIPKRKPIVVPGQALSPKEIWDKWRKKVPALGNVNTPVFWDQTGVKEPVDPEAINRLEFGERDILAKEAKRKAAELKAQLEADDQARKKASDDERAKDNEKRKAEVDAAVKAALDSAKK